ncbi:hypothetical protein [Streptomyces sp. NPDC057460]|uniref:hypothetical protein n=1 Tax=Streptomyces sp. NPDC057460 TaxID=3346141 RepID=UPI0036A0D658
MPHDVAGDERLLVAHLVGDEEEAVTVGNGIEAGGQAEAAVVLQVAEVGRGGKRDPLRGEHAVILSPR